MPLLYDVPTAAPQDDIEQYRVLLLAAIEAELDRPGIWNGDEETALDYIERLKEWVIDLTNP